MGGQSIAGHHANTLTSKGNLESPIHSLTFLEAGGNERTWRKLYKYNNMSRGHLALPNNTILSNENMLSLVGVE